MESPYEEYKALLNMVKDPSYSKDDVYATLMKKEENVLNTVNRVIANDKKQNDRKLFYNMTIVEAVTAFSHTWKNIFNELFVHKQTDIYEIFVANDRLIYLGIMIVTIAIILYFIDISK